MEILFDGTYDKNTFVRGLRLIEKSAPVKKILRWVILIILVLALGAGIYEWITEGATSAGIARIARHGLTAALLGYYYASPAIARWSTTSRLFKQSSSLRMTGRIDLDGVTIGPGGGQSVQFRWEQFIRKGRQEQLVALLTVDGSMALFHRRFFQNEPDWGRFLQLVEQRVTEPK
jgi:hypothetical protein